MDKTIKPKWFSLKKTYIFIMTISIIVAIILSTLVSTFLTNSIYHNKPKSVTYKVSLDGNVLDEDSDYIVYTNGEGQTFTITKGNAVKKDYFKYYMRDLANLFIVCIIFLVCIIIGTYLFYRWKLKKPLKLFQFGIDKVSKKELDFELNYTRNDEMGLLCNAFENMRKELYTNFKEQWKAQEDRRILNAAFAHDLRTPLTVLNGQTDLLLKNIEDDKADKNKIMATLILLKKHISNMNEYTDKMSTMQRLEDLPVEKCQVVLIDFVSQMKKHLQQLAHSFQKKLEFITDIQSYSLDFDENVIMHIFENVANNAFRFANDTVKIDIKAGNHMIVTISDDGPGFSEKALLHASEPFFREKQSSRKDNFGLGLYICNILLKKHGGSLYLANLETGGACVKINI